MKKIYFFDHPLIQHKLAILRDKNTKQDQFRKLLEEITLIMGYVVTGDLLLTEIEVETPIQKTPAKKIGKTPFLVVVMRAGDGMKQPMLQLLPTAKVGFIGLYRKEGKSEIPGDEREDVEIAEYFNKLPVDASERDAIILDPMIASGTSASHAIKLVKKAGVKNIKFMCIVTCHEGIVRVTDDHPDVQFFCAAMDEGLLKNNYIYPGLGDAGDRLFGTK